MESLTGFDPPRRERYKYGALTGSERTVALHRGDHFVYLAYVSSPQLSEALIVRYNDQPNFSLSGG